MNNVFYGECINDADYPVRAIKDGEKWICPYFNVWFWMLFRCYERPKHKEIPVEKLCSVCDEWKLFSVFKTWMQSQPWQGRQLDKDILIYGNKIYRPEACAFVSKKTNCFVIDGVRKTDMPKGVSFDSKKNRYIATISMNCKTKNLGKFRNADDAGNAYKAKKYEFALEIAEMEPDLRVGKAILDRFSSYREAYQS